MHKFNMKNLEKLDNPKRRQTMPPDQTLQKFNIDEKATLLDVGCGIGYFSIAAAGLLNHGKVIGIDIMDEILEVAKSKSEGISNIVYLKSEEYAFPVQDSSVEYVFICNVIHEVQDKTRYFEEIKRVLMPGGFLCIIEWEKKLMEMGPPVNERVSHDEIKTYASAAGMRHAEDVHINNEHYGMKFILE